MPGSINEKIREIVRAFTRKRLTKDAARVGSGELLEAGLEEDFQAFQRIIESIRSNRVATDGFELYALAFQEMRISALGDILPEPHRFIEISRDKVSDTLWNLQNEFVVQGKDYSGVSLRQLLLKSRNVLKNEQNLQYGDWVMIEEIMGEVLNHAGMDDNLLLDYSHTLTGIFEGFNGYPTPKVAQLELQGKYRLPDWKKMSSLWEWKGKR